VSIGAFIHRSGVDEQSIMNEAPAAPRGPRGTDPSPPPEPAVTVWFDSACPLCVREIALMRRLDRHRRIAFADVHSEATDCPLEPGTLLARFHAQEAGREIVSGAAAFAAMWRAIPVLKPLGLLARIPPVLWLMERAYLVFLKLRPGLQRLAGATLGPPNASGGQPPPR
jgi:predicted DCC family thiol-disulfide oxidoreductase YuxK